jgi:hypothetical protein
MSPRCRLPHRHNASFLFWNRTRRTASLVPFGILLGLDTQVPYVDYAVFDFLVSLPLEMTWDQKFHSDAIQRAFPDLRVPYASKHPYHRVFTRWRSHEGSGSATPRRQPRRRWSWRSGERRSLPVTGPRQAPWGPKGCGRRWR